MNLYSVNKSICNASYKNFCNNVSMNFDTYAKRLNWAMTNAAISQSELARAIGVKPQAIQYLCQKGTKSTHTTKIAKVLGVSADWLDTGKGQPHPKAITATKTTLQSEPAFCFSFHRESSRIPRPLGRGGMVCS